MISFILSVVVCLMVQSAVGQALNRSFLAVPDNNPMVPPSMAGPSGPYRVMTALDSQVRIQDKSGNVTSADTRASLWASLGQTGGVFTPRLVYDPFAGRWIFTVVADSSLTNSALLVAGAAVSPGPILISRPTSTRAVAFEAVSFMPEPFAINSAFSWVSDGRTHVMLFAMNLALQPGDDISTVSADAEDAAHRHYRLVVEYVGPVPANEWMSEVILRLSDDLTDVGDVLVQVGYRGAESNRVRVGIGHVGGGLPDDSGATPTPIPALYTLSGKVVSAGQGLAGAAVILSGSQTQTAITDASGSYSFTVSPVGSYGLTPQKPGYSFNPLNRSFTNPTSNQTDLEFAALQTYSISGHVRRDNNQGLDGIQIVLTDENNQTTLTTITSGVGVYSFSPLIAGHNFRLEPTANTVFLFQGQTIAALDKNLDLDFVGTRFTYSIGGGVVDHTGNAVRNLGLTLSGGQTRSTTTDNTGRYSFPGVPAGLSYTVAPSLTTLDVFPPQSEPNLIGNQTFDFAGVLRTYTISGRMTNSSGNRPGGVRVVLSGSQSAVTLTANDGTYSFPGMAAGNYRVTPSIEQGFYTFSPISQSVTILSSDATVDFAALLTPLSDPPHVLEFDGSPMTVDYGNFWAAGVNLGHFFWEFWARPNQFNSPSYLLSDGYGGLHSLLFGLANFGSSEPGRYMLLGDISDVIDTTHVYYFGGDQGPAPGEWAHFAVGWDGREIICYYNGVPVGKTAFAGPRQSPGPGAGGGRLLIGGSDHLNFQGRIAEVRGSEGSNPREDPAGIDVGIVEAAFVPQTFFSVEGNLLSYFFRPASAVADLSSGYGGSHIGTPRGTTAGVLGDCGSCPPPRFVIDPTAPNFVTGTPRPPLPAPPAPPAPGGALVFDSFSRSNSLYTFGALGGLGTTEFGPFGPLVWQSSESPQSRRPFGILNGQAVMLANATYVSWVTLGASNTNLDIRVDRHPGLWQSGLDTGLSFRVQDEANYFFAYTTESPNLSSRRMLTVGYVINGQHVNLLSGFDMPDIWTTLQVVTTGAGELSVYADGTLVYQTINDLNSTVTGAGLYNNSRNMGLVNRWDNFTVFSAP